MFRGGGGYSFRLRGDPLRRHLKETQSTIKAIFSCVPTTLGSNCSTCKLWRTLGPFGLCIDVEVEGYMGHLSSSESLKRLTWGF